MVRGRSRSPNIATGAADQAQRTEKQCTCRRKTSAVIGRRTQCLSSVYEREPCPANGLGRGDARQIPGSIPMAATSSSSAAAATDNSSDQNSATITANDFLTLLVTELKNQDPTANTDPNAYVNQLVQVNSLQQLIQINTNTTATPSTTTTSTGS